MAEQLIWVKNDLGTKYLQIRRSYDDSALDLSLSTTTVSVKFRAINNNDASLWTASCTKVIANLGLVSYDIPADGLDQTPGRFQLEATADFDGSPETIINIIEIRLKDEFPDVA